jgi:hypothetical protein
MDEGTQITAIWQDYDHHRELAVGLYRVWDRKRVIQVWAADGHEALIAAAYAGLGKTSVEPVLVEEHEPGNGKRA